MRALLLLFLLLILTVYTSGCTVPGTNIPIPGFGPEVIEETSDVVRIKSLNIYPQKAAPNQQVRLVAYIENTGKESIPQKGLTSTAHIKVELYDYCSGMFNDIEVTCPNEKSGTSKTDTGCTITKLLPKEIKEIDWKMTVSNIPLKTQCELKVYVQYPYKTTSITTVYFINQDEMQRQLEQGTFKSKESLISKGPGPIKAYLTLLDDQPIPIKDGSGSSTLSLNIENRGKGFPHKVADGNDGNSDKVDIKKGNVKLTLPEGFTLATKDKGDECAFKDGKSGSNKKYTLKEDVRLIKDKSSPLICPVKFNDLKVPKESTMRMTVEVEYEYEFRKSVLFTVEPKV